MKTCFDFMFPCFALTFPEWSCDVPMWWFPCCYHRYFMAHHNHSPKDVKVKDETMEWADHYAGCAARVIMGILGSCLPIP